MRSRGDWGGAPLEDLQERLGRGAAEVPRSSTATRACALGASYGGYMVYWIAGNWNEPWKCIVAHDGVFDSRMMGYSTEELWFDEWENGGKTAVRGPGRLREVQPDQPRQGLARADAGRAQRAGFPHPGRAGHRRVHRAAAHAASRAKFLHFPDENHWVLKPQNSVLWHDTVNAWLKQWTAAGE